MKKEVEEIKGGFKLCGGKDCCPTVKFKGGSVFITDDFGGKVKLSKKEFDLFQQIKRHKKKK